MRNNMYIDIWGGLGDVVLSTPVFEELKTRYPQRKIIVIAKSKHNLNVLRHNPFIDSFKKYKRFYRILSFLRIIRIYDIKYGTLQPSIGYSKKAQHIIAEMFDLTLIRSGLQLYTTNKEDAEAEKILSNYKNPLVFQTTSKTSENQMWPKEKWTELITNMKDYTFIHIGTADEDKIDHAVDMRGLTNVRQAIAITKNALGFVGVVSFLSHVTNAFDKRGVVLFGPSSVSVWGHENNINLSKNLPCAPCIDILLNKKCPYNKPCLTTISVAEVREAIISHIPVKD